MQRQIFASEGRPDALRGLQPRASPGGGQNLCHRTDDRAIARRARGVYDRLRRVLVHVVDRRIGRERFVLDRLGDGAGERRMAGSYVGEAHVRDAALPVTVEQRCAPVPELPRGAVRCAVEELRILQVGPFAVVEAREVAADRHHHVRADFRILAVRPLPIRPPRPACGIGGRERFVLRLEEVLDHANTRLVSGTELGKPALALFDRLLFPRLLTSPDLLDSFVGEYQQKSQHYQRDESRHLPPAPSRPRDLRP